MLNPLRQSARGSRVVFARNTVLNNTRRFFSDDVATIFSPTDKFQHRHMGEQGKYRQLLLDRVGFPTMEALLASTLPSNIRFKEDLVLDKPLGETEALRKLHTMMDKNQVKTSLIGMGFYETITPGVILRNVMENPGWYTAYTPYQAEISQGRMESLLNFQTMVSDMTGLPIACASLLDESTAAAEAMGMC